MAAKDDSGFQLIGSGPEAYERYMVPIHCTNLTSDLLDSVSLRAGESVLDIASGTGVVARGAAQLVGPTGKVVAVELNPAMIDVARRASEFVGPIEFLEGAAESLPVPDNEFDAAICQQAIMFFSDRAAAVKEMYRVLKPGGRLALAVFRSLDHIPGFIHFCAVLKEHIGADAEEFMQSPFVMDDLEELRSLFNAAGFEKVEVTIRVDAMRYPSVAHMVSYETLNLPGSEVQSEAMQKTLTAAMTSRVESYIDDRGLVFPVEQFVVIANK